MGLCNATATFQRLMNMIFSTESNELGNLIICYVDDVLVATKTINQHLDRLAVVFEKLQSAGLKMKPKNVSYCMTRSSIWGGSLTRKDASQTLNRWKW